METITIRLVAAPATTNRAAYDLEGRTYERQAIPRVGEWVQDGMYTAEVYKVVHNLYGNVEVYIK